MLAFKGKTEYIAKKKKPNIAYRNQFIDIEIPHGSRDLNIFPGTVKIMFNLHIESIDKTRSIDNNVGRSLVKRMMRICGPKETDTVNNADIYDTSKCIYLRRERNVRRSCYKVLNYLFYPYTHSVNYLKTEVSAEKADGKAVTVTAQENAIKILLVKISQYL